MVWSGSESVIIYFGLTDLVPLVERAHAAERMFERTMGDFQQRLDLCPRHPGRQFEGDPIEFYRGSTAEVDSAIASRGPTRLTNDDDQTCYEQLRAQSPSQSHGRQSA